MTTWEGSALGATPGIGALTLGGFLTEVCATHAEREALVFDDPLRDGATVRWTYADLEREARSVAAGLIARGVGHSTRVAIVMGNRPEMVAAIFGVALAGGVAVPLSTFSAPAELRDLLTRSAVSGVLTQTRLLDATLAHALMPFVVPQLKTITLGGAVTGLGIESSSFRNGLPHESVRAIDVLTGA